jgi:hypothetical protein
MYLGFGEFIYLLFMIYDGEKPRRLKKTINPSKVPPSRHFDNAETEIDNKNSPGCMLLCFPLQILFILCRLAIVYVYFVLCWLAIVWRGAEIWGFRESLILSWGIHITSLITLLFNLGCITVRKMCEQKYVRLCPRNASSRISDGLSRTMKLLM